MFYMRDQHENNSQGKQQKRNDKKVISMLFDYYYFFKIGISLFYLNKHLFIIIFVQGIFRTSQKKNK